MLQVRVVEGVERIPAHSHVSVSVRVSESVEIASLCYRKQSTPSPAHSHVSVSVSVHLSESVWIASLHYRKHSTSSPARSHVSAASQLVLQVRCAFQYTATRVLQKYAVHFSTQVRAYCKSTL